jgi:hypothetical protein
MTLHEYDYVFAIGTLFAMLDAYNNGASKPLPLYVTPSRYSPHTNIDTLTL